MAALLRRALRAAALLAGAPRRAAAAWTGKREPPDRALEEAERCGAAGPRVGDRGRAAHLSPPQGTAAGGSAAAAAAAGAGRGARSPRAHPDLAGDGADAVPAAGAARGVAPGAPGPRLRRQPRCGAAGAAEPGLSPAAPPPAAGREGPDRGTGHRP